MDDLKASTGSIEMAHNVHIIVKRYAAAAGMVINTKKSAIQLSIKTPLPEPLLDIPRMDNVIYRYLRFEMKKGDVNGEVMTRRIEERIEDKLKEPAQRVEVFKAKNLTQLINQNIMSVVRFYSGPVKFTLGWLDRIDRTIRRHLAQQGMLMKRGMATSSLYMSPDDMGTG